MSKPLGGFHLLGFRQLLSTRSRPRYGLHGPERPQMWLACRRANPLLQNTAAASTSDALRGSFWGTKYSELRLGQSLPSGPCQSEGRVVTILAGTGWGRIEGVPARPPELPALYPVRSGGPSIPSGSFEQRLLQTHADAALQLELPPRLARRRVSPADLKARRNSPICRSSRFLSSSVRRATSSRQ